MRTKRISIFMALSSHLLFLAPARADTPDLASADALFKRGIKAMEAAQFDIACPALSESQRLDPRPGTRFAMADCQDKAGKIATAVALYRDYLRDFERLSEAQRLRHAERRKLAIERIEKLSAEIPELTLVLPSDAPAGTRVWRDETQLDGPSLGMGLPLDPGGHTLRVEVPGREALTQQIVLDRSEKKTVVMELPAPPKTASPTGPNVKKEGWPAMGTMNPAAGPKSGTTPAKASAVEKSGEGNRLVGPLIAGGLGLAGLVTGSVAGYSALEKKAIVDEHCVDNARCDREGKEAADSGKTMALVSTVSFGVGIAGVATGIVLWFTGAPSKKALEAKPKVQADILAVGAEGAVMGLKGVF